MEHEDKDEITDVYVFPLVFKHFHRDLGLSRYPVALINLAETALPNLSASLEL
jgi:hypothetical protein